jgi:predicted nucleic acid-binding protein
MPIIVAPPETPLIIDTNIFSDLRKSKPYVQINLKEYFSNTKQFPAISSMTVFEANFGIEKELSLNNITIENAILFRQEIDELIKKHRVLPFDQKAAEIAAYVYPRLPEREFRKKKGKMKKIWQDLFIITTVVSHNYGLATPDKDAEIIAKYLPEDIFLRLAVWKP